MFASILNVAANIGYPSLFLLVMAESAGIPLPGETALVTGALLASHHKLQILLVIALAASGAIIGDNLGYLIGRRGGRWLLERPGPFARSRRKALSVGVPFFDRHGPSAVFFGRWLIGLRTWAAWLAGAAIMPWKSFARWNALGGLSWATTIGLVAYFAGGQSRNFIASFGAYGLVSTAIAFLSWLLVHRRGSRRRLRPPREPTEPMTSGRDLRRASRRAAERQPDCNDGRSCRVRLTREGAEAVGTLAASSTVPETADYRAASPEALHAASCGLRAVLLGQGDNEPSRGGC